MSVWMFTTFLDFELNIDDLHIEMNTSVTNSGSLCQSHSFYSRPWKYIGDNAQWAIFLVQKNDLHTKNRKFILHLIASSVLELRGSPADSCHGKLRFS